MKNTVLSAMFHRTEFVSTESGYKNELNVSVHKTEAFNRIRRTFLEKEYLNWKNCKKKITSNVTVHSIRGLESNQPFFNVKKNVNFSHAMWVSNR